MKNTLAIIFTSLFSLAIMGLSIPAQGQFQTLVQIADKTIANTTVETSLLNLYAPTNVFNTDQFIIGNYVKVRMIGYAIRTTGTLTINVKLGSTVIMTTGAILTGNMNNDGWVITVCYTYRAVGVNGKIRGFGSFVNQNTGAILQMTMLSDVSVNLSTSKTFDITAQWSIVNIGNSITSTNIFRE